MHQNQKCNKNSQSRTETSSWDDTGQISADVTEETAVQLLALCPLNQLADSDAEPITQNESE